MNSVLGWVVIDNRCSDGKRSNDLTKCLVLVLVFIFNDIDNVFDPWFDLWNIVEYLNMNKDLKNWKMSKKIPKKIKK